MKLKILNALTAAILFLMPNGTFAQAPTLGTAAKFVLFTTNGAMTCSGTKYLTHLTGDVGSNLAGSVTGFGNVDGVMHDFDVASGLCVPDVVSLYTQLSTAIPTNTLASPFGNGVVLLPGVYSLPLAATLNLNLTLDAAGDPNAIFIFQIGGVFTTNASAKVRLINGALACNVFWQVNGAVNVGTGTSIKGTIVANGQIDMTSTLDTLEGRAFAMNAAVLVSQLVAYTPLGCGSPYLVGPVAPALASTATYGVFSSIGAVTSTPVTYVIGDVGANSTTPTGFDPANVTGAINAMNPSTAAAAGDLTNVYNYLVAMPADINLLEPGDFGHGLVLTPHSYQVTGITQLTGDLILNAQGNPNAVFVIKINGAFTTGTLSRIMLINGTQAKNVYWKVDGAVDIFSNSVFNGTLVVAGAITLNTGDTLNGRALSINGAIAINGSYVNITPPPCVASPITGTTEICGGTTTTLSNIDTGGVWQSSNPAVATIGSTSGSVTGIAPGTSIITFTSGLACVRTDTVTVNSPASPITGTDSTVCVGSSIAFTSLSPGGIWSSSNVPTATIGSSSGIVTGVATGFATITYTLPTTCFAVKAITVNPTPNAGTITGTATVCPGNTTTLSNTTSGGTWTSANTSTATIGSTTGIVTGVATGTSTISYTVANGCGTAVATRIITVNATPNAGTITGTATVCPGNTTTLSNTTGGGTWTSANTSTATIGSTTGIVTGVTTGTTTISYTVTNGCGTAAATRTVTVNPLPNAGVISGASAVCPGSSITLTNGVPGGTWSSSNANATVSAGGVVTGVTAGSNVISYTATTSCGTAIATKPLTISPLPNAGSISGASTVCVSSSITLTNIAPGGTWSAGNPNATVSTTGVVTGVTAGSNVISYTATNSCGTAISTKSLTINPLPNAGSIFGASTVCVGSSISLTNIATDGTWSSSNANATVSTTGLVTGFIAGPNVISYTVTNSCGTAISTKSLTISPLPNAGSISGPSAVCVGSSATLTNSVSGGTWSSSNANATISAGGVVTGVTAGPNVISYAITNSCGTATSTALLAISPLPNAGSISGAPAVCVGSSITLINSVSGGAWSSSNANATVSAGGIVTGLAAGMNMISYTVTNSCGTDITTKTITVNPLPDAGSISGASGVCLGAAIQLTNAIAGGTWSSSNIAIATVSSGFVTGITAGTAVISYSVSNICGTDIATKAITVNVLPSIPVISTQAPLAVCAGTMYQNFGAATQPPANVIYKWTAVNANVWAQGTGHQYALISFTQPGAAYVTLNATQTSTQCSNNATIAMNVGTTVAHIAKVSYFNSHFVCTPANEDTYQWGYDDALTLDSTILKGEINQDYLNTSPDFYNKNYWVMTTLGGCMQKTYYHTPTAIQNVNNPNSITIHPNPANDIINVVISSGTSNVRIDVLNMLGQTVTTAKTTDGKVTIDVAALPAGSYLVACYNDGIRTSTSRFIKN